MSKTQQIEIRSFEVRIEEADDAHIEGLLVPYDVWTDVGGFREKFAPGAFTEYLSGGGDVVYNYAHDRRAMMGRRESGTLEVEERDDGVHGRLLIPDTQLGRDMRVMIGRGDIRGHSIEFWAVSDRWETLDGIEHREVTKAELPGVALTGTPAYKDTTAALRSLDHYREQRDEAERKAIRAAMRTREARLRLISP